MKYKVGIGIFAGLMLVCLCYMGSYQHFYVNEKKSGQLMSEESQAEPANAGQASCLERPEVNNNGHPFFVKLENGFAAIYEEDKRTVFEYTDFRLDHLTGQLKKELEEGKYIYGVRALFDLLENHTG